jgi:hypothetical protein
MMAVLLAVDAYLAGLLLFASPSRFLTPAWDPARLLVPWLPEADRLRPYGVLALALTATTIALWWARRPVWRLPVMALAGMWAFLTVMFTVTAFTDPYEGLVRPALAAAMTVLHWQAGRDLLGPL